MLGRDDLELVLPHLLDQVIRLVLPGEEHVADPALRERDRRSTRARVEHRHVLVERADELLDLRLVAAELLLRPGPRRQVVPARAARGLGVRRHHAGPRLGEVAPVLDAARVALAHDEHDGRRVGRRVVGQALLPAALDAARVLGDGVDVERQRQRRDVGLEAVDDRARLLARSAVRLVDVDRLPGLLLPLRRERLVDVLVQLARRIVGDVQQLDLRLRGPRAASKTPPPPATPSSSPSTCSVSFVLRSASSQKFACARPMKTCSVSRSAITAGFIPIAAVPAPPSKPRLLVADGEARACAAAPR